MAAEPRVISADDRALLDRLAARIVELRLETPALLTLESARPVSLLASSAMVFFEPLVQALFRLPDYRRFSRLIEDRDALELLVTLIEDRAAVRAANRKAPGGPGPGQTPS